MIKKTVRIDGNEEYEYSRVTIALIDGELYLVEYIESKSTSQVIKRLTLINKALIASVRDKGQFNKAQLLDIIRKRFVGSDYDADWNRFCGVNDSVVMAMKLCDLTREEQIDVGGIKGLIVSNWHDGE